MVEADYLPAGHVLNRKWKISSCLGRGAFGEIYEARCVLQNSPLFGKNIAIKVEKKCAKNSSKETGRCVLKLEAIVLKKMQFANYVGRFIEYGFDKHLSRHYVCMELLGENLLRLRRNRKKGTFSLATALRLGIQGIRSIEGVHKIGFLHRDIKPSNFMIGIDNNTDEITNPTRILYIVDFGLCRYYRNKKAEKDSTGEYPILPARTQLEGFRGTPRYASAFVHKFVDMGRRDDLWSLLFMLIEMTSGKLPWAGKTDKELIGNMKELYTTKHVDRLLRNTPRCLSLFLDHLNTLLYDSTPDYDYLCSILESDLKELKINESHPYDWETKISTLTTTETATACANSEASFSLSTMTDAPQHHSETKSLSSKLVPLLSEDNGGVKDNNKQLKETPRKDHRCHGKAGQDTVWLGVELEEDIDEEEGEEEDGNEQHEHGNESSSKRYSIPPVPLFDDDDDDDDDNDVKNKNKNNDNINEPKFSNVSESLPELKEVLSNDSVSIDDNDQHSIQDKAADDIKKMRAMSMPVVPANRTPHKPRAPLGFKNDMRIRKYKVASVVRPKKE